MNNKKIIDFLKELSKNNNREWFAENKHRYEEARQLFYDFIVSIVCISSKYDLELNYIDIGESLYRIYRDTRFSHDKTPYKTRFASHINKYGRKSYCSGFYIHLEPNNCIIAGGVYCAPTNVLNKLRKGIYDNIDEYKAIVEDEKFKKYFKTVGEEKMKVTPKGYDKNDPNVEYIKCKDFTFWCNLSDDFFYKENVLEEIKDIFVQTKRYSDFVNPIITE